MSGRRASSAAFQARSGGTGWSGASAVTRTRRSVSQTISQIPQAMVTIRKLGGKLNIADAASPIHTEVTLMAVAMAIARAGRGVSMMAVAGGAMRSANNNSVPTACTAIVTV